MFLNLEAVIYIILTGLNEYAKWSVKSLEAHKKIKIYDNIQNAIKEITA